MKIIETERLGNGTYFVLLTCLVGPVQLQVLFLFGFNCLILGRP